MHRKIPKTFLLLLFLLIIALLSGCASVKTKSVGNKKFAPRDDFHPIHFYCMKPPRQVEYDSYEKIKSIFGPLYQKRNNIPEHITIARIEIKGTPAWTWQHLFDKGIKQARKLGGDAIIITRYDYFYTSETESANSAPYGRRFLALVIRYTESGR